jgi:hypothetical protein
MRPLLSLKHLTGLNSLANAWHFSGTGKKQENFS